MMAPRPWKGRIVTLMTVPLMLRALVAMLSRQDVRIPLNGLTVMSCRINVWIWRARVIKDKCLEKVGQREHTPR
jgi:hypothetical protein